MYSNVRRMPTLDDFDARSISTTPGSLIDDHPGDALLTDSNFMFSSDPDNMPPDWGIRPYKVPRPAESKYINSPYGSRSRASSYSTVSEQYSFTPDPRAWGANVHPNIAEEDDDLHNPYSRRYKMRSTGTLCTSRGIGNIGCLVLMIVSLVGLFAGYPTVSYFMRNPLSTLGGFGLGGINATGQVPQMGNYGLIDIDTPLEAYTRKSVNDGSDMELVFSDEFDQDGRSFYPGDDPYWEAVDLYYWATQNLEWYDPAAVTTGNGKLRITMSEKQTHDLNYEGGMLSTWNKFCFTGGYIEASVSLPGVSNVVGLWPAIWTMGNLGRAGYGASLEGMWPYTYDACDVGTAPNQTRDGVPQLATIDGDSQFDGALSYLQGQKLSRCTCQGESHPGPMHEDGTYVGRSAPEIDVFEAQLSGEPLVGEVSQSSQWAPFNYAYQWFNNSETLDIPDPSVSYLNPYAGGALQQATSVVSRTNQDCYTGMTGCFSTYGFEYKPGFDDAYITWVSDNKVSWTLRQEGLAADQRVEISARPIPQEPLYIIMNLGMSFSFSFVDLEHLVFPVVMEVDYIRVYQPKDAKNVGCDPEDFPTANYINTYIEAYTNPNLTTWRDDYGQPFPRNSFLGEC